MARAIDADRLADGLKLHRQPADQKHEADRQWAAGYNAGAVVADVERMLGICANAKEVI